MNRLLPNALGLSKRIIVYHRALSQGLQHSRYLSSKRKSDNQVKASRKKKKKAAAIMSQSPPASSLVGSLPPIATQPDQKPISPPPLFWKAYALALRSQLTLNNNLENSDYALFFADPRQSGIPAGSLVEDSITNYQLFIKADTSQVLNRPVYGLDGNSYFDQIDSYLRYTLYAKEHQKPDLPPPIDSKLAKEEAWELDRQRYIEATKQSKDNISFVDWMKDNGDSYQAAWTQEKKELDQGSDQVDPALQDLINACKQVEVANNRLVYSAGSNMPCVATDVDYTRDGPPPPKEQLYYQPLYSISNYEATVDYWISSYKSLPRTTISLNFEYAKNISWSSLGHPGLDSPSTAKSTDTLYDGLEARVTFTGLRSFDVNRGEWDPKVPVRELGDLPPSAPPVLRKPMLKTTKILLGYGVDLIVTLPDTTTTSNAHDKDLMLLDIPISAEDPQKNEYHSSEGNNAYPVILGVLAKIM